MVKVGAFLEQSASGSSVSTAASASAQRGNTNSKSGAKAGTDDDADSTSANDGAGDRGDAGSSASDDLSPHRYAQIPYEEQLGFKVESDWFRYAKF